MICHRLDESPIPGVSEIPMLGLGLFRVTDPGETLRTITCAWEAGYRYFDTAAYYDNEEAVGEAFHQLGKPREQYFLVTKIWPDEQRRDRVYEAALESLARLGQDYVDLILLHWPARDCLERSWKALERLVDEGRCRYIGVANHLEKDLERILTVARRKPILNQLEIHPRLPQAALRDYCKRQGILPQAYCPLMRARLMDEPHLLSLALKHGRSVAQIILRWQLQHGVSVIPKSSRPERIRENIDVFGFELTAEEMTLVDALETGERICDDPATFPF